MIKVSRRLLSTLFRPFENLSDMGKLLLKLWWHVEFHVETRPWAPPLPKRLTLRFHQNGTTDDLTNL